MENALYKISRIFVLKSNNLLIDTRILYSIYPMLFSVNHPIRSLTVFFFLIHFPYSTLQNIQTNPDLLKWQKSPTRYSCYHQIHFVTIIWSRVYLNARAQAGNSARLRLSANKNPFALEKKSGRKDSAGHIVGLLLQRITGRPQISPRLCARVTRHRTFRSACARSPPRSATQRFSSGITTVGVDAALAGLDFCLPGLSFWGKVCWGELGFGM